MICIGPGFHSDALRPSSPPPPSPLPPVNKSIRAGEEPNYTTARKPGPLCIKHSILSGLFHSLQKKYWRIVTGQIGGENCMRRLARRMKGTDCAGGAQAKISPRQILSLIGRASGPCQLISIFPPPISLYLHLSISFPCNYHVCIGLPELPAYATSTKYLHIYSTEQCLASTELLTPHPLTARRVCPPPAPKAEGYTLAGR
jgi:hypothetical protein